MPLSNVLSEYKREEQRLAGELSKEASYWYRGSISLALYLLRILFYGFVVLPPMLLVWPVLFSYDFNLNALLIQLQIDLANTTINLNDNQGILVNLWVLIGLLYIFIRFAAYPWQSPNEAKISEHMTKWHSEKIASSVISSSQDEQFHKKLTQPEGG